MSTSKIFQNCDPVIMSRLFSAGVLRELAQHGRSEQFLRLLQELNVFEELEPTRLIREIYEHAFELLKRKAYRDEYIYKAALTHKVLLGKHNLSTATMLSEFRVGASKADVVILNGTSTVYEIKSERDSLARLMQQLDSYSHVFAKINVITGENHLNSVMSCVSNNVGVLLLSDRYQISTIQEAQDNTANVCPGQVFDAIQISEAKTILTACGFEIPELPNTRMYQALKSLFVQLTPVQAHAGMVDALKHSRTQTHLATFIQELPAAIQPAALTLALRKQDQVRLCNVMNTPMTEALKWR